MTSYIDDYKDLKEIIRENPTLPLIFMASEDVGGSDYSYTAVQAKVEKGVFLNEKAINDEKIYSSEDDLEDDLYDYFFEENDGWTEVQVEEAVKEKMEFYKDKWIDVIYVWVSAY